MEKNSRVDISVLRDVLNRTFDFIKRDLGQTSVELDQNFYWSIANDVLYAMDEKPSELDCGSLADDWEFVQKAASSKNQTIPITFLHVAPVLQAMAKMVPSYASPSKTD